MKAIRNFQEFVKERIVKKQSPDKSRSEFLIKEAANSYDNLLEKIQKIGVTDNNANDFIKSCYDIIMERGVYIECDARGDNEQSALCIEKGIQGYPTWEFQDGMMLQGVMELHTIAEKAGCEAPRPE